MTSGERLEEGVDPNERLGMLAKTLRGLGMVVVTYPDGFDVRLATFEKVRVSLREGALHMEPFFALVPRARATLTLIALMAMLIPELFISRGLTPLSFSVAFVALLSAVYQAIRYTTTDSCMTRIQMAWLALQGSLGSGVGSDRASLPEGQSFDARSYSEHRQRSGSPFGGPSAPTQ